MEDEVVIDDAVEVSEVNEDELETNESQDDDQDELEEESELEDKAEASDENDEAVEEAVQMIRELKLKIDGEELVEELPFEVTPEQAEYLKKELQMSKMAQKRAQEAADLRKSEQRRESELKDFLNTLKTQPQKVLEQMGVNIHELYENIASEELRKAQLTPEQQELEDLKNKLREVEEKEAQARKNAEEREMEMMKDKYAAEAEKEMLETIEKHNLPNSPYIIGRMVNMVQLAQNNNLDLSFKDVGDLVKEEYTNEVNNSLKGLSAEQLMTLLSNDVKTDFISKATPKKQKVKEAPPSANSIKEGAKRKEEEGTKKFRTKSTSSFFKDL